MLALGGLAARVGALVMRLRGVRGMCWGCWVLDRADSKPAYEAVEWGAGSGCTALRDPVSPVWWGPQKFDLFGKSAWAGVTCHRLCER